MAGSNSREAHKLKVADSDEWMTLSRARWLAACGRARIVNGTVAMLEGRAHGRGPTRREAQPSASPWSDYSRIGLPNPAAVGVFQGMRMNGAAINRVAQL